MTILYRLQENKELEANTVKPELIRLISAFETNDLKTISQNIRSINTNFDKLLEVQSTINADIIVLQECWQPKKDYHIGGYDQKMTLRKNKMEVG